MPDMSRSLPVLAREAPASAPARPRGWGLGPSWPRLVDGRGRAYTYLRLSLTDRCDMACVYCMPPSGEEDHALRRELLTFEEIVRLVDVFVRSGVRRVRLTGGEPLVRKDIVRLVAMLSGVGVEEIVMTTNAGRLAQLAGPLRDAGLRGVNISIDSLEAERFARITRGGSLPDVLCGIHAALDAGLEVKLNCVALAGVNDDEIGALVDFAWARGITPRFIELMPLGEAAKLPAAMFLRAQDIAAALGDRLAEGGWKSAEGRGPARYAMRADGSGAKVGFITAISDEFCESCNRVRVTAAGDMRACLASRRAVSLRDLMRAGASDVDVAWAIQWSLDSKDEGHRFTDVGEVEHTRVGMSLIGG